MFCCDLYIIQPLNDSHNKLDGNHPGGTKVNIKKHKEIIIEALGDYRKWFDGDPDKLMEIDSAINHIDLRNFPFFDQTYWKKPFPVISVCRDDIIQAFNYDPSLEENVMLLKDHEMEYLASKLADDYCEQLFWASLKSIFESNFLKTKEMKKNVEYTKQRKIRQDTQAI